MRRFIWPRRNQKGWYLMTGFLFKNPLGGVWSQPGNWNQDTLLPGTNDQVSFIDGTYISTVDAGAGPWSIQSLDVNIATVSLDVDVSLSAQTLAANQGTINVANGANFTVGSLNSNNGSINVFSGSTLTVQNLNGNGGSINVAPSGTVVLKGTGTGNFTVAGGLLEIDSNFNGGGTITMNAGTVWIQGQLGSSTYDIDNGVADQVYFDNLQSTTNNSFIGAGEGDRLAIENVTINDASYSGTTLTLHTTGGQGTYTFTNISLAEGEVAHARIGTTTFQSDSYGYIELACFAAGTRIDTPDGPVAVEALREGQPVLTAAGASRLIRWIGRRQIDLRRHPNPVLARPIRILAGALAPGLPRRDLFVSPDHALMLGGNLIPARLLVNGATIRQDHACQAVTYYHVELDSHDLLLAEGAAAESYLDTGNRTVFENAGLPLTLHPDFGAANDGLRREAASCAPFVTDEAVVHSVWHDLASRAEALGFALPEIVTAGDPDLRLELAGQRLKPIPVQDGRYLFALPRTDLAARLVSRATAPSELQPWSNDRRPLGVLVRRMTLRRDGDLQAIPLDHPSLNNGWWAIERHASAQARWTSGAGELSFDSGGPALLEIEIGTLPAYRMAEKSAA